MQNHCFLLTLQHASVWSFFPLFLCLIEIRGKREGWREKQGKKLRNKQLQVAK